MTMPKADQVLLDIADYVCHAKITSSLAYDTARWCLLDALGCAALSLQFPECRRLLGPIVPGTIVPQGARVCATDFILDPVQAAFNMGTMIRYLDYNDTWLAKEWGHPSDNIGAILAAADYCAQRGHPLLMQDVLTAIIKTYEIQGVLALENAFNEMGLDHVILLKVASSAVITHLMGGSFENVVDATSQAWLDGHSLRTYRHAPNTASRKSWAAGDAVSRAVRLAMLTLQGESGYKTVLTAPKWGFNDVFLKGESLKINRAYGSYVIENILFKVLYPAEFHAQTALEAAIALHTKIKENFHEITKIEIETQSAAMRIINKQGELKNPADRDHCLQYIVAVGLQFGELSAHSYSDAFAQQHHTLLDKLRHKMQVIENKQMTADYYDETKRAIPNAITIHFNHAPALKVQIDYPLGHVRRRAEALPLIQQKAQQNLLQVFSEEKSEKIIHLLQDPQRFTATKVTAFCQLYSKL